MVLLSQSHTTGPSSELVPNNGVLWTGSDITSVSQFPVSPVFPVLEPTVGDVALPVLTANGLAEDSIRRWLADSDLLGAPCWPAAVQLLLQQGAP